MFGRLFIFVFLITLISSNGINAQGTGTISGTVEEKGTKDLLPGVNVFIEGTTIGTSTSIDGTFEIKNVPSGNHVLICSFIGYEVEKTPIVVNAGQVTQVNFSIGESQLVLGEVNIVAERRTASDNAVILEMKEAKQLVSGISRQQMSRSQDSDAAKVMQRIPGVTIVGNRFVMIRGVAERYNQVMINGVIAPSTEVDRRTFSFDLIPSGLLDRMVINKTGSPEFPGDFAGGVIKVFTLNNVQEDFTSVNIGLGYRVGTTFNDFQMSEKSGTDFLGFDRSFRPLPSGFPGTREFQATPRNAESRQTAARSLPNNWNPTSSTAMPDYSFGLSLGRSKQFADGSRLMSANSFNYSKNYQYYLRDFFRYDNWVDREAPIFQWFAYDDNTYVEEVQLTAMSNWTYVKNSRNRFKFKNFFTQVGENQSVLRSGINEFQRPTDFFQNYMLGYRSRSIYSGQLIGEHSISAQDELTWVVGGSILREKEPDLRRFRTFRDIQEGIDDPDTPFEMQLPPSSNLFDTGRYFGDLFEYSVNNGIDYKHIFKETSKGNLEIAGGTYVDYRSRRFDSRYFSFLFPGGSNDPIIGETLSRLPLDQIFAPENILPQNGFVLEEGTRPIDGYTASNFLVAGYVSGSIPIGDFYISGGLRVENMIQRLDAEDDFSDIVVELPVLSLLPSINASYHISEKALIRGGYSRTVNRPEFRELAPFFYYDYELDAGKAGNPNLRVATIDNLDLRYEFYPRLGEVISFGTFFKRFYDPIEAITVVTNEQPQFTFGNADGAQNFGFELEFRKSLKGFVESGFLSRLNLIVNASYIWSEVDLGDQATNQDRVRALQGQSPYIINLGGQYVDNARQLSVSAYYNVFGARIFSVGDVLFPTIYELPRNSVDITINKEFNSRIGIKLGVRDLLNARYRFVQDSDRDGKISDVGVTDHTIFSFQQGQLITGSVTFKF